MTYLTEAAAWRKIARKIVEGEWSSLGLCYEIGKLRWSGGHISWRIDRKMWDRINEHLDGHACLWDHSAYPMGEEPEGRALAALWMALEAEEDARVQRRKET